MKFKKIIVFGLMLAGCLSCSTDLEEEIFSTYSSNTFYQNEEQLQAQNLGIYEAFKHVTWEQDMYFLGSMTGKYATTRAGGFAIHAAYRTPIQQPFRYDRTWRTGFIAIARANTVIKNAPLSAFSKANPDIANRYIAEARWMRAYTYFQLTQLFGDLPLYTEPVETPDPELLFRGRSATEDIYDVIIEDLIFANENLPVNWPDTGSGRVTKAGAAFLLGKVYLTSAGLPLQKTENYQKAIDALKPLADNPDDYDVELANDWKNIFSTDNEGNKEIIFALGNIGENNLGGVVPFFANPFRSTLGGVQTANGANYLSAFHPTILDLYEADDIRLADGYQHSFILKTNGNTVNYVPSPLIPRNPGAATKYQGRNGICSTKYIDGTATNNVAHTKDHIIYRYVDTFLMLAEAYNENSDPANALSYLDIARSRVNASQITEANQDALRTIIREERIRELYAEMGEMFDARRWGTVEQEFNESELRKWRFPNDSWDPKFILSPLPVIELSKNPNLLPDNPGW